MCKFTKYVKVRSQIGTDYCSYQFDIEKYKYQKSTLKLNMILGNTDECLCSECKPDTSSDIYAHLRTNFK